MTSGLRLNVVLLGGWVLAFLPLSRFSNAQPFVTQPSDYAITNDVPILLLSGNFNGWSFKNNLDLEISSDGGSTIPLVIGFSAPANSLTIADNTGNVGFGTSSPAAGLHVRKSSNPALRLESAQGSQSWELRIDSSVSDLTLKDVDTGDTPFSVRPGTPSDTLHLADIGGGQVGIGTIIPNQINGHDLGSSTGGDRHLNLKSTSGLGRIITQGQYGAESYLVHIGGGGGRKVVRSRMADGKYLISSMDDHAVGAVEHFFCANLATWNVGVRTPNPLKPFQVGDAGKNDGNGAHVTPGGVWTNASSRSVKQDIEPITSEQARDAVRALQPVGYRYKNELDETYVGFIAEDVPELVATKDRKSLAPMDVVAVLTKVVQDQERQLADQGKQLTEERQRNERERNRQQQLIDSLAKRLADLEAKAR